MNTGTWGQGAARGPRATAQLMLCRRGRCSVLQAPRREEGRGTEIPPCHAGNCRLLILGPMLIALAEGGVLIADTKQGEPGRKSWLVSDLEASGKGSF